MLDNNKRKELLSKARQSGFPGSILDVFTAYEQGRDLIAEYQQEQRVKQAQQMSDFVASQTLQPTSPLPQQQPQQQLPSSPPIVQANVPVQMPEQQQPLVDSSRSTNVGIVPNQTGSYKGEAIFAKGGFKKDPPNQGLSSMGAENRLYTYKNDPNWFDSRSNYSDDSRYSDQIRRAVYSGNYGYNPVTGVLEKLPINQRTSISSETKRRLAEGENKQAYQKSIVDAGLNPETFGKMTADEEKALEDRRMKDYIIKGHELAINNPAFKTAAYFTPVGMAVGAVEGAVNFAPDLGEFALNPSWSGAGKVGMDALMSAPLAGKIFKPQINRAKSFLNEVKGEVTQGRANRAAIEEGNTWLKNWIEHPSTQAKIDADMNAAYNFRDVSGTPGRLINLIKEQSKTFKPSSKEYGLASQLFNGPMHQGNFGVSYMHNVSPATRELYKRGVYRPFDEYGSFISRNPKIPQGFRASTTVHEGTHDWVPAEALKKSGQRNIILKNLDPKSKENFLKWEELTKEGKDPFKFMSMEDAYSGYLADPTEVHARIMELRKAHEIKPGEIITSERANDILQQVKAGNTKIDPAFAVTIDKQDPKKLAELFNRLWVAAPATGVGIGIQNAMDKKAKGGFKTDPPKDYPKATPPPAWMPIHTVNPVEVKANRFNYNIDPSKYPDLGLNQPLPNFRPIRKSTLEEEIYWNQVPDFYKKWGKDDITENVLEFLDPTGILSHDDARRAYESWKASGREKPTSSEALDMFGAVPGLGRIGKVRYVQEAVKPITRYIPWQQILNALDFGQDITENKNIDIRIPEDKKYDLPSFEDVEVDTNKNAEKTSKEGTPERKPVKVKFATGGFKEEDRKIKKDKKKKMGGAKCYTCRGLKRRV